MGKRFGVKGRSRCKTAGRKCIWIQESEGFPPPLFLKATSPIPLSTHLMGGAHITRVEFGHGQSDLTAQLSLSGICECLLVHNIAGFRTRGVQAKPTNYPVPRGNINQAQCPGFTFQPFSPPPLQAPVSSIIEDSTRWRPPTVQTSGHRTDWLCASRATEPTPG